MQQSEEEQEKLNLAIGKLQEYYDQGLEIRELLEFGPGGWSKDGEIRRAAEIVGDKWGCKIGEERARKVVEFSVKFTSLHMLNLVNLCVKNDYCPEFGLIKRLFPLGVRERNRLLKQAIIGRWKKTDLDAEIEKMKPAGQLDPQGRGRRPKATKSLQSLAGQARLEARNWRRVIDILDDKKKETNVKLTAAKRKELRALVELLEKLAKWDD